MATKGVVIERIKGHLKKTEIVETGHAHFIVVGRIGCRSKSPKWLCQRLQLVHCDDSPLFNGWALSIVNACHLQRGRITTDRRVLRSKLDGETDFVVTRSRVTFRKNVRNDRICRNGLSRTTPNHRSGEKYSGIRKARLGRKGSRRHDLLCCRLQQNPTVRQRQRRVWKDAFRVQVRL